MKGDPLGDRMKEYERRETDRRFMPFAPVIARMDGRGFSRWTAGLERPFDAGLSRVMIEVTRRLVAETGARIGYTQSDEITLVLLADQIDARMMFDGKAQKLCSVLASMTTSFLMLECLARTDGDLAARALRGPQFDARVFQVPTRTEAANAVLWREIDAGRNSVSTAARTTHTHRELQGRSSRQMIEMMASRGFDYHACPDLFRRGSFLQARTRTEALPADVLARMGVDDAHGDHAVVAHRSIERIDMPPFSTVANREAVIFEGAEPETRMPGEDQF